MYCSGPSILLPFMIDHEIDDDLLGPFSIDRVTVNSLLCAAMYQARGRLHRNEGVKIRAVIFDGHEPCCPCLDPACDAIDC